MNRKKYQSGSGHLIIIFIILAVIIACLTFVLFQNFLKKNNDKIPSTTSTTKIISKVELSKVAETNSGLAINYPSTWSILVSSGMNTANNTTTYNSIISSPDGKIDINFNTFYPTGFGQTCIGDESINVIDTAEILEYPETGFVAYSVSRTISGETYYKYYIGAQMLSDGLVNKSGEPDCNSYDFSQYIFPLGANDHSIATKLYITFNDYDEPANSKGYNAPSLEYINEQMATEDYQTAKRIIQSLYVKE